MARAPRSRVGNAQTPSRGVGSPSRPSLYVWRYARSSLVGEMAPADDTHRRNSHGDDARETAYARRSRP